MNQALKKFFLKNKTVLIVGGSGQIGFETCKILLNASARVINIDLFDRFKFKKKNYQFHKINITDEKELKNFKKLFIKKYKKLNILINHSHYKGNNKSLDPKNSFFSKLENYPSDQWQKTLNTNLNGLFYVTKHFIKLLIKNKNSVILNTSSTYGKVAPNPKIYGDSGINSPIGYATTKSAIVGFTKYIATHYSHRGLRANILVPGGVQNKNQSKKFKKKYSELTPLNRLAKKDEYKETVLFLVSDASSYMTGSEIVIDGGWTAW